MVDPSARIAPARGRMGFQMAKSFLQRSSFRKAWAEVTSLSVVVPVGDKRKRVTVRFTADNAETMFPALALFAPHISAQNPITICFRGEGGRFAKGRDLRLLRRDTQYPHLLYGILVTPREEAPAPASE